MKLHELNALPEAKSRKRVGRGPGSGMGKTSTRGEKGQKSRSGASIAPWFQGGQTPLYRRLPKRGFSNAKFTTRYATINLDDLNKYFKDVNKMIKNRIELLLYNTLNIENDDEIYFTKCYEICKISSLDAIIDCELQDAKYKDYMKELNNIAVEFANKNTQNIRNSKTRINELKLLRDNKTIKNRIAKENMVVDFIEGFGDEGIINSYIKDVGVIIENLIEL